MQRDTTVPIEAKLPTTCGNAASPTTLGSNFHCRPSDSPANATIQGGIRRPSGNQASPMSRGNIRQQSVLGRLHPQPLLGQ